MTKDQAKEILLTIAAAYPKFNLTDNKLRVNVWVENLLSMPFEAVKQRLNGHVLNNPFPPSIAEIAVKPKTNNDFLSKQRQWEEEVRAERIN